MLASDIPAKFQTPFAVNATEGVTIRTVPQTSVDPNAASFNLGFPPNTFAPQGAGGQPPNGMDFNGLYNVMSAWLRWLQAGGAPVQYDATFQTQIGGYPAGARVGSAVSGAVTYLSLADNNLTNPDLAGAGWLNLNAVGGVLNGTLPNPGLAAGVAAANVGTLGGDLSGTLPSPTIKSAVNLTGSPTIGTDPSLGDISAKIASTRWAFPAQSIGTGGYQKFGSGFMMQWGGGVYALQVTTTSNVPVPFSTFFVVITQLGSGLGPSSAISVGSQAISTSQFNVLPASAVGGSVGINWLAFGF